MFKFGGLWAYKLRGSQMITVRGRKAKAGYHLSAEQFIGPQPTKYIHYFYSNTIN